MYIYTRVCVFKLLIYNISVITVIDEIKFFNLNAAVAIDVGQIRIGINIRDAQPRDLKNFSMRHLMKLFKS